VSAADRAAVMGLRPCSTPAARTAPARRAASICATASRTPAG